MRFRFRILGAFIMACGLAFCYGAIQVWPPGFPDATVASMAVALVRAVAAALFAVIGVLNVVTGGVVLWNPPAADAA